MLETNKVKGHSGKLFEYNQCQALLAADKHLDGSRSHPRSGRMSDCEFLTRVCLYITPYRYILLAGPIPGMSYRIVRITCLVQIVLLCPDESGNVP